MSAEGYPKEIPGVRMQQDCESGEAAEQSVTYPKEERMLQDCEREQQHE